MSPSAEKTINDVINFTCALSALTTQNVHHDTIRSLGELVPEFCYCACSLIDQACCDTQWSKAIVGHSCVGPQYVFCETHRCLEWKKVHPSQKCKLNVNQTYTFSSKLKRFYSKFKANLWRKPPQVLTLNWLLLSLICMVTYILIMISKLTASCHN